MYELPHEPSARRVWIEHPGGEARIELRGSLPVRWCNRLTAQLAARQIGVLGIHARRGEAARWTATVDLDGAHPAAAFGSLAELVDTDMPATPLAEPPLHAFSVTSTGAHGGSVELAFAAPDRVGLLAAVFDALSMHTLFPVGIEVHTRDGWADDRLWLKGLGNAALGGFGDEARVREALTPLVDSGVAGR